MKKPCLYRDPLHGSRLALVKNGDTETYVCEPEELAALISEEGTTEVTLLRNCTTSRFLTDVPSFTLDLNGHTLHSLWLAALRITKVGTKNSTTVVKNGTIIAGRSASSALMVKAGGLQVENTVLFSENIAGVIGLYQTEDTWNKENRIENCVLCGWEHSAITFAATDKPDRNVSVAVNNSVLLAAEKGGTHAVTHRVVHGSDFAEDATLYAGSSVILGKNIRFLMKEALSPVDGSVKQEGEAISFAGDHKTLYIPALGKTVTGLRLWETEKGEEENTLAEISCDKKEKPEIVLPVPDIPETEENRRKAMEQTAAAYFNKNPYVQYDWIQICRAGREHGMRSHLNILRNAPEYASQDMTVFSVCAAYANMVGEQSFGYKILGGPRHSVTKYLSAVTPEQEPETFVFQYNNTGDEQKDRAAMEQARSLLKPGDVVTYTTSTGYGHCVIFISDVLGQGCNSVIHCSDQSGGGRYNIETGMDKKEKEGGIVLNRPQGGDGEWFFFGEDSAFCLRKMVRYSIVRPAAADPKKFPIREPAKTRILYPGLTIFYTADCGFYGAVEKNKTLTYTLKILNKSPEEHRGLKVQIPCPENADIVKVDGEDFSGNLVIMTLSVPAGQSVVHTVTVKATGDVGEKIFSGGYVHTIPLPIIPTAIASRLPNTAWEARSQAKVPAFEEVLEACFDTIEDDILYYERKKNAASTLDALVVQDYYGGTRLREAPEVSHRVLETRLRDLLPGDVLYVQEHAGDLSSVETWVYDGEVCFCEKNGCEEIRGAADMMKLLSKDFFVLLRPSQMG